MDGFARRYSYALVFLRDILVMHYRRMSVNRRDRGGLEQGLS